MTDGSIHPLHADMLLAMRRLARSVAVISCSHAGRRYSMSATAVDALSTEPPSLLICINRTASLYAPLDAGADFCVNVLSARHRGIAIDCSGRLKGEARFTTGNWQTSVHGVPYLHDAQASLVCAQDGRFVYGTHTVFIGRLTEVLVSGEVDPLVYVNGAYTTARALVSHAAA
ncbi:flavin reductase family protein [Paraburkholderia hayleyella]|uniref:flavin reductase family protein n=1 Tax=Paraburkholderia hayleyella TaxID=2152889 RepID=UPI0012927C61|nr:flavin reductase family protein [Paraburkholderia hayleyella]